MPLHGGNSVWGACVEARIQATRGLHPTLSSPSASALVITTLFHRPRWRGMRSPAGTPYISLRSVRP
jgi:hypothetical protein